VGALVSPRAGGWLEREKTREVMVMILGQSRVLNIRARAGIYADNA
jgi:hypothetical protein